MRGFAHLRHAICIGCLTLAVFCTPLIALADEGPDPDGRLEGYGMPVALKDGGTVGTMIMLLFLMAIALGVMFINAKRSHLD